MRPPDGTVRLPVGELGGRRPAPVIHSYTGADPAGFRSLAASLRLPAGARDDDVVAGIPLPSTERSPAGPAPAGRRTDRTTS